MKIRLNNRNEHQSHRQTLRKESTPQERILWSKIRNLQLGARFRRQHSVGPYILDFYCASKCLAIEIDGSQHLDHVVYDEKRTVYLQALDIRVLRFGNHEVNTNIEGVLMRIQEWMENSTLG